MNYRFRAIAYGEHVPREKYGRMILYEGTFRECVEAANKHADDTPNWQCEASGNSVEIIGWEDKIRFVMDFDFDWYYDVLDPVVFFKKHIEKDLNNGD